MNATAHDTWCEHLDLLDCALDEAEDYLTRPEGSVPSMAWTPPAHDMPQLPAELAERARRLLDRQLTLLFDFETEFGRVGAELTGLTAHHAGSVATVAAPAPIYFDGVA
jgi:hypothetical protein